MRRRRERRGKSRRTLELFGRRKGENPSGAKLSRLPSSFTKIKTIYWRLLFELICVNF